MTKKLQGYVRENGKVRRLKGVEIVAKDEDELRRKLQTVKSEQKEGRINRDIFFKQVKAKMNR